MKIIRFDPAFGSKTIYEDEAEKSQDETFDHLLRQVVEGLEQYDACNRSKLDIARRYGPLLIELKERVPHGSYEKLLKQAYPRVSYDTCNRWVWIAKHERQVAQALAEYPDVKWSITKMTAHIKDGLIDDQIDDDDESDHTSDSEAFASQAEAAANDTESVTDSDCMTVTVMLTSTEDFEAFREVMPDATRSNHNQTLNLTQRFDQDQIGDVLRGMASVIESTELESLKLMVTT